MSYNIALFIRSFKPCSGGLQKHAEDLARELIAKGHRVRVVTRAATCVPDYKQTFCFSERQPVTQVGGIPLVLLRHAPPLKALLWLCMKLVHRPGLQRVGIQIFNLVFAQKCLEELRGVDLIHHIGQGSEMIGFTACEVARRLKVPFLVQPTVHPGQWGDGELDLMLYRQADRLLAHTRYEASWFVSMGLAQPFDVVGNGIEDRNSGDALRFRAKHGINSPMVLFLGRKDADKGYDLVKQAAPEVWKRRPDVAFVFMGPRPPLAFRGEAKCPLGERCIELDSATDEDKHDALAACSCLCVPSEGESFGLVYMEAGRYGKPVIGRRIPVLEELIGGEGAGLLIGDGRLAGNRVEASRHEVATAILKLIDNEPLATRLGESCRRVSDNFVWARVVQRFEAAYKSAHSMRCSSSPERRS